MDFTMYAGDSKTLVVTAKDEDGAAVDITDATIRWQLARSVSTTALVTKSIGDGVTITDGSGGVFEVELENADTESLKGEFYHEAEAILTDGTIATVLSGTATINRTLIKPAA